MRQTVHSSGVVADMRGPAIRIVLADIKSTDSLVTKDTVAGGYGSRFVPFSRATRWYCHVKRSYAQIPSIQLGYLAAICADRGHEVVHTRGAIPEGDVAVVLSSLVDYRREVAWADAARRRGLRVGFVGLACSKLPELFRDHADFLVGGEPETAITRLASGAALAGECLSPEVQDLDSLPFPRWDLVERWTDTLERISLAALQPRRRLPLLASRSCPESCTYCPHRILSRYRTRSIRNIADELAGLCARYRRPVVIFRDPLFTQDRERVLSLCDEILSRGLDLEYECETRLDHLDPVLLGAMRRAGLRALTFGVESISAATLRKVARRPIPEPDQRRILGECRRLGIWTVAFYVFGFLQDDWSSIAATIEYAISLGSTLAQFKILTPYPGTPLWKQVNPLIFERDWERFDGFTPTFHHPNLKPEELRFLIGAAYARFYARPSFLQNLCGLDGRLPRLFELMDRRTLRAHRRLELAAVSRTVAC